MMHTLGILELLLPEFHGIDALVIRDAYHRYTVDEHTLVVIDTLHGLEQPQTGQMSVWAGRFGGILRDVQHPALLFLAALLHDTGRDEARTTTRGERADGGECGGGCAGRIRERADAGLIAPSGDECALRRTSRSGDGAAFAAKVQTLEALRMLTLFTYADIQAVHPDR